MQSGCLELSVFLSVRHRTGVLFVRPVASWGARRASYGLPLACKLPAWFGATTHVPSAYLPRAGVPAATLTGAMAALMEAVRAALHADALRITTLEAENAALNKCVGAWSGPVTHGGALCVRLAMWLRSCEARATACPSCVPYGPAMTSCTPPSTHTRLTHRTLQIVRTNANRSGARSRGLSTPGVSGITGAAAARATVAAAAAAAGSHADDAMSEGSACTADEDAFDVVEAFDDGAWVNAHVRPWFLRRVQGRGRGTGGAGPHGGAGGGRRTCPASGRVGENAVSLLSGI